MIKSLAYKSCVLVLYISWHTVVFAQSPQLSPSDYSACFDITIDHTKVSGITDLTDFSVLIDITNASLRNTANGGSMQNLNGYDILFTGDCDEVFHHDLELYTETTGRLVAWVRVPTVYATQATSFKLNYGNVSVTDNTSNSATWSADYEGVWHLHDDFLDATGNNNDATNNGSVDGTAQIGDGQNFDGSSQYVQTTSNNLKSADDFSISVWFNADQTNYTRHLVWQGDGSGNGWGNPHEEMHLSMGSYTTMANNDVLTFFLGDIDVGVDPNVLMVSTAFTDITNWHHAYVNVKNLSTTPTAELYLDGVLRGTDTGNTTRTGRTTWDTDMRFGRPGTSSRYYDGILDEVKTTTVARSVDWILTEYNNQNSPGTFYSVVAGTPPNNDDTISGNLFEDLDADGIKDAGEVGHASATVQLLDDVNEDGLVDGGDVVIQTTATDANGDYNFNVPRKSTELEVLINDNDAEQETISGNTFITSADMDMGNLSPGSPYTCGFRYDDINIPNGAVITRAYLEFVAYSNQSAAVELTIDGHDHDDAPIFADGSGTFNISSRTRTSEKVNWSPGSWTAESTYYSPDLSEVIQEIINRAGWASGNAMALIIEGGLNKREAYGWSSDPDKATKLRIEYYVPPLSEYYLVNLDETTLPPNFAYTTVSEYDFNFTSCGSETSSGNEFGIQLIDICGNGLDDNNDGQIDEPYPGGVGENLLLWLKADAGFSPPTWTDQSPNGNNGTTYGDPAQVANAMNFNPGINFDGDDHVEVSIPELAFDAGTHHAMVFVVYKPSTASTAIGVFGNQGPGQWNMSINNNWIGLGSISATNAALFGTEHKLVGYEYDEDNNVHGAPFTSELKINGTTTNSYSTSQSNASNVNSIFHIGKGGTHASSLYFQGDIMEIIIYYEDNGNFVMSDAQRDQVESYLGIKYGISLGHDFMDSQ